MPAAKVVTGANKRPPPTSTFNGLLVNGLFDSSGLLMPSGMVLAKKLTRALTSLALLGFSVTRNSPPVVMRNGSCNKTRIPTAALAALSSIRSKSTPRWP